MWVSCTLKCPDQGAWVALTRIDADGNTHSLGYVALPFREMAAREVDLAIVARADERDTVYADLRDWSPQEVVDLVLDVMHPYLAASIDVEPQ